jgi:hypothetical protein
VCGSSVHRWLENGRGTTGKTELRNLCPGRSVCVLEWLQMTEVVGLDRW